MLVLFSGEKPPLDNSMAVESHNAPRNIGFVKVPQDMTDTRVLSAGAKETGGFYNFGGGWSPQENKGINWITDFKSMEENASRLKATKLSNGQILILFETWTGTKYVSSNVMTVDQNGQVTRASRASKYPFRMPFADEILSTGSNTAVFFTGDEGKLVRYEVSLDPSSAPPATTATTKATTKATTATTAKPATTTSKPKPSECWLASVCLNGVSDGWRV